MMMMIIIIVIIIIIIVHDVTATSLTSVSSPRACMGDLSGVAWNWRATSAAIGRRSRTVLLARAGGTLPDALSLLLVPGRRMRGRCCWRSAGVDEEATAAAEDEDEGGGALPVFSIMFSIHSTRTIVSSITCTTPSMIKG
jgi:hypothetical protein